MSSFPDLRDGADRPTLRLFSHDGIQEPPALGTRTRLSQFFRHWFVPNVLEPDGASEETIGSYAESIRWWSRLTGDPPLVDVDTETKSKFRTGLKEATYCRGQRGAPRSLAKRTIIKHERQVGAVLFRAGPGEGERQGASLLTTSPHLAVTKAGKGSPKPRFLMSEVTAILAAAPRMPRARRKRWPVNPGRWWVARLALLFYTGLRIGTIGQLTWRMLEEDATGERYGWPGHWLKIPGSLGGQRIVKTGNDLTKFLHPAALAAIERTRPALCRKPDDLISPWFHHERHFSDRHEHLQRLAKMPENRWLSPHAWRRTHAGEMFRLGAQYAQSAAQRSLDHADARTTREFYFDGEAQLIARLPHILPAEGDRQLDLF